jgi:molecular chaperone GrpE
MSEKEIKNKAGQGGPELVGAEGAEDPTAAGAGKNELEEMKLAMARQQADFQNYRKRIEKERGEDTKRTTARVVEAFIPTIDSFEQALALHREAEYEVYRKGFELIHKQLLDGLTRLGVERMEPLGRQFDPHQHQAMDRTETTDKEDGEILEVFQPGYVFHGKVLRPAMVRVAVQERGASNKAAN